MARNDNKKTPESQESLFSFGGDAKVPGQSVAVPGQSEREQEAQANSLFSGKKPKKSKDELGPQYGYKRHAIKRNDEVSVYTEQMDARYAMDPRGRTLVLLLVVTVILIPGLSLAPTGWLTATGLQNGIAGVINILQSNLTAFGNLVSGVQDGNGISIVGPIQFFLIAIPLIIGIAIIMVLRGRLNLLAFEDDEARSMGISVGRTRAAVIAVCTIMTAVVVSFCGNVGFVGFLIPHIARKVVGPDLHYLIPASALLGSVYLLLAHYVMSLGNILSGSLGTFTSLIGAIFFIVVLIYQRRRGNVDWI